MGQLNRGWHSCSYSRNMNAACVQDRWGEKEGGEGRPHDT
jgi:hypothetical protein